MSFKLLLSERMPEPGMAVLAERADLLVEVLARPEPDLLARSIGDADGVVLVMERPALDGETLAKAPRLKLAARMGAGVDNFDVPALTARGIPLLTTGAANAGTVAEHALYLMLALAKRGIQLDRAVRVGRWPRTRDQIELSSATCLIVGYGRIGREIAKRVRAFGMQLLVADPAPSADAVAADGGTRVSLQAGLPQADFVVLACALTPATRHLIDAAALALMRPSAYIVNVARGGSIDQTVLVAALQAGRIAGAGLDVLAEEPPASGDPLLALDTVVLSPHVASHAATAYDRMSLACARSVLAALDGCIDTASVVNPEVLTSLAGR